MNNRMLEFWVGIFVLAGFAALLFLALKVGNLGLGNATSSYAINASFGNIGSLKVRAPVRAAGVTVGRVTAIDFDTKRYQATVTMALDGAYRFPTDTSASILTAGVLGENYVGLDAGGEETLLADGGQITITQSAVVLEHVIGQFLYDKAQETSP
ncbi:MAG: outer membrane lipid asymmetry maintenance protein MlaD [Gammaproteobacteria bacterium]|nr:outer membrane lipid asymmetry maintenance protein MlaD [Gammaproteobacteria bacterium]